MVTIITNTTRTRRVVFGSEKQKTPSYCSNSTVEDCFTCFHGVAAMFGRSWTVNLHKYISICNLSSTWKLHYQVVSFWLPFQADVDAVIILAQQLVATVQHMRIPVALSPPHGRPEKQTWNRKRYWYEKRCNRSKRLYTCSLCRLTCIQPVHVSHGSFSNMKMKKKRN